MSKNIKKKTFTDGSFCNGYTTSACDFHQNDSEVGLFKKGDQKLRKLIIIKNFKDKFFLVQFIGNNNSKPYLRREFVHKNQQYFFNLQNCYIIPRSYLKHVISFIENKDFKWIKKDCLNFIDFNPKRKRVYEQVSAGKLDYLSENEVLTILKQNQFNSLENRNRNNKKEIAKRIKFNEERIKTNEKEIEKLKNIINERILEEEITR